MKSIKHPVAIRLFDELREYIPISSKGTYNRQDPTHYEKGSVRVKLNEVLEFEIKMSDITWGVTFEISRVWFNTKKRKEIGKIYKDGDELIDHGWKKGMFKLTYRLLQQLKKTGINYHQLEMKRMENWEEDPMGSLSDYE
jgi:hypothetical protein